MKGKNNVMKIKVDIRELESGVYKILKDKIGANIAVENLNFGDYVINNNVVIERKTTTDFVNSIIDGRLFRQALGLKRYYERPLVLIEGDPLFQDISNNIHPNAIKGALVSLSVKWKIPVIFSKDPEETAIYLSLISAQNEYLAGEVKKRQGKKPKKPGKRPLYFLTGLPYVGEKTGLKLLNHFGSIEKVVNAPSEELREVPGVGNKKVEMIKEVLLKEHEK
jgi:Fanconi anemia group M protein